MTRAALGPGTAVLLTAVLAAAACGGDEQPTVTQPAGAPSATGSEAAGARDDAPAGDDGTPGGGSAAGPGGDDRGGDGPDGDGAEAAGDCRYQAPPGRLGERTIEIAASGVGCGQARRLAVAAALGQPAGANIPVRRADFLCEPSTRERGADVVYTCSSGSAEARFEVVWARD